MAMDTKKQEKVKVRNDQIKQMRKHGITLQAIGKAFGLTRERVRQVLLGV